MKKRLHKLIFHSYISVYSWLNLTKDQYLAVFFESNHSDDLATLLFYAYKLLFDSTFSSLPLMSTVIFLSFRTDRSGQTVQTAPSLIRVYTVCNSLCIFWMHYSKEMPSCSTFRVITTNFLGVRIFRKFTVVINRLCFYMSLVTRKPVFGVSDQLRFKPAYSATD